MQTVARLGESGQQWIDSLPGQIARLSRLWKFSWVGYFSDLSWHAVSLVERIAPNTTSECTRLANTRAVLKLYPPNHSSAREVKWLRAYPSSLACVPQVFASESNALLMEYSSGISLASRLEALGTSENHPSHPPAIDEIAALESLCRAILQLRRVNVELDGFPHYAEYREALGLLSSVFPQEEVKYAWELYKSVSTPSAGDCLLHADLHHGNLLVNPTQVNNFTIIDPHGTVGDPVIEAGPLFYNPKRYIDCADLRQLAESRLNILSRYLPYSRQRLARAIFAQLMLSIAWELEDGGEPSEALLELSCYVKPWTGV